MVWDLSQTPSLCALCSVAGCRTMAMWEHSAWPKGEQKITLPYACTHKHSNSRKRRGGRDAEDETRRKRRRGRDTEEETQRMRHGGRDAEDETQRKRRRGRDTEEETQRTRHGGRDAEDETRRKRRIARDLIPGVALQHYGAGGRVGEKAHVGHYIVSKTCHMRFSNGMCGLISKE
ncbi:hypothetical protein JB92DRAFT_2825115 [Gautieria morchelliformis]|nr:hypothetical protein JB92DRAFT_2825115 [Gautieria morchelliformis]